MKALRIIPRIMLVCIASACIFWSCDLFEPALDEVDLYGTWTMDEVSVDVDVSGDNFFQVLALRSLIAIAKDELNDQMNDELDSLGATMTFNADQTFVIALFDESDTGTYVFDTEARMLTLVADSLSVDEFNVEKLNAESLNITWISAEESMEISDTTDAEITVQVILEAWLSK